MRLHASPDYILKGIHAAPLIFEVYIVAPCISRSNLKYFHTAPVNLIKRVSIRFL